METLEIAKVATQKMRAGYLTIHVVKKCLHLFTFQTPIYLRQYKDINILFIKWITYKYFSILNVQWYKKVFDKLVTNRPSNNK